MPESTDDEARPGAMICNLCRVDVPPWLWTEPGTPGAHHVILTGEMTVRTLPPPPDAPPDRIRVVAEHLVAFAECRDHEHPVPVLPPPATTGLDRMRAAVDAAREIKPPDRPVTLCGGPVISGAAYVFDPAQFGDRVEPRPAVVKQTGRSRVGFLRWLAEKLFA